MTSHTPPDFEIRPMDPAALLQTPPMSATAFDFKPVDQIAPWLLQTTAMYGGITLGAFAGPKVVGYSFAFPGFDRGPAFLISTGLVVHPEWQSRGVGLALKLEQRRRALSAGFDVIRWTATSLASRALYVYVHKLGARITRFHADLYETTLNPRFPDEVEIEWHLRAYPPPQRERLSAPLLTTAEQLGNGLWAITGGSPPAPPSSSWAGAYVVEVPWDRAALARVDPAAANESSRNVRRVMTALLEAGYRGTDVDVDRNDGRSFVYFEHPPVLS